MHSGAWEWNVMRTTLGVSSARHNSGEMETGRAAFQKRMHEQNVAICKSRVMALFQLETAATLFCDSVGFLQSSSSRGSIQSRLLD